MAGFMAQNELFHNRFANALYHSENHDKDIYAIFDRYWRLVARKYNAKTKSNIVDIEYFKKHFIDNNPNSEVNEEAKPFTI